MEFSGQSAFREPSQFLCFAAKCYVYKHCKDRPARTLKCRDIVNCLSFLIGVREALYSPGLWMSALSLTN